MAKKSQRPYFIDYNLLTAQDVLQARYQILLIILLQEFIKLNSNTNMIIRNVKYAESDIKIEISFLNTQTLKMI